MPRVIEIVPVAMGDGLNLEDLCFQIGRVFRGEVRVSAVRLDPRPAYDRQRHQYHSTSVLAALLEARGKDSCRVLGITSVDLFVPILTFVFGEAQLDGPAAVVSTCRLAPEFYGLAEDPALLHDRLVKECLHELAHTFGLVHCRNQACVLFSSAYAERIDLKGKTFCLSCQKLLVDRLSEKPAPDAMRHSLGGEG